MTLTPRWTKNASEDRSFWEKNDPSTLERINTLISNACEDPGRGIGKPERLRSWREPVWSRRINKRDRLVYTIRNGELWILQCRFHYDDT